jgi:hypothetical protein
MDSVASSKSELSLSLSLSLSLQESYSSLIVAGPFSLGKMRKGEKEVVAKGTCFS